VRVCYTHTRPPVPFLCFRFIAAPPPPVGYGDVGARTRYERIISIVAMVFGGAVYAYVIGSICGVISKMDPATAEFRTTLDELNLYMAVSEPAAAPCCYSLCVCMYGVSMLPPVCVCVNGAPCVCVFSQMLLPPVCAVIHLVPILCPVRVIIVV
jgi:hypothetical protein